METRAPVAIDLYGAERCSLCDAAWTTLERLAPELGLELHKHDIATRPDWRERFRYDIPVVFVAGEQVCIHRVDEPALRASVARARVASGERAP